MILLAWVMICTRYFGAFLNNSGFTKRLRSRDGYKVNRYVLGETNNYDSDDEECEEILDEDEL